MRKIKNILNKLFLLIVCILLVFVLLLTNTNKKVLAYTTNENLDLFESNVDNSSHIYENFEDDNVIVVLDTKVSKINKIHNVKYFSGIEIESIIDLTKREYNFENKNNEFKQILQIYLKNKGKENVLQAISYLKELDGVFSVEPNYFFEVESEPNDPEYLNDKLWGLNGTNGINVEDAWNLTKGSSTIRVGVIDTGIANHEDLNSSLASGIDTFNNDFITNDDTHSHGTHVAGTIGAVGNNEIGVVGVNWNVSLVPLQAVNSKNRFASDDVVEAIEWAQDRWGTDEQISIINYSVTGFGCTTAVRTAISDYSGLFIWCAGNEEADIDERVEINGSFNLDNIISVGALNSDGTRRLRSNYSSNNTNVHIYAPGANIYSTVPTSHSTSGYSYKSGTSMAAPHVTGVAALLLSLNEELTAIQLKEAILESAEEITISIPDTTEGAEENDTVDQNVLKLNAYNAVKYVLENFMNPTTYTLSNYSSTINTNKTVASDASYFDELNGFYKLNVTYAKNYEFISSSASGIEVSLYDEDFTEILFNDLDSTGNKVHFIENLSTGTYYLKTKYASEESTGTINTKIVSRTTTYLECGDNDILVNTYNNIDEYNFINSWGAGFYKFTLDAITSNGSLITYPNETLKIYDNNNEYQEDKYNVEGYSQDAENLSGANYLYMYLERDGYYYIHIDLPNLDYSDVILNIERVSVDEIDVGGRCYEEFIEVLVNSNNMTEYAVGFSIDQTAAFDLTATTSETYSGNITLVLFKKEYNSNTQSYYKIDILGDYLSIVNERLILEEGTYYIGFFGNTNNVSVTVTIDRIVVTSEIIDQVLVMDPSYALPYGTEVRHNGGILGGTTITEGFTRHVHFQNIAGVPSVERKDYNFYSSNTSYATVSEFGTVFAKSVSQDCEVTIIAIYKYNPAIIFRIDLVIKNDTTNTLKVIESTQTIKLSDFVDGKYKLLLYEQNSPYPWIQYFNWSIFVPCQETEILVTMDQYGFLTTTGTGSAILTGEYIINPNVTIVINIIFE